MIKVLLLLLLMHGCWLLAYTQNNPPKYNHKIIAVLPFRVELPEYRRLADSNLNKLKIQQVDFGTQLQANLYQAITSDTNRLLVEVQPWEITDSLLRKARVDFTKITFLDLSAMAAYLKVDACVVSTVKFHLALNPNTGGMPSEMLRIALYNVVTRNDKQLFFTLVDQKSGEEIWRYEQNVISDAIKVENDKLVLSPLIFKSFKKRFPYCN